MIIMNKPGKYSPWLVLSLSPSRSVLLPCSLALSLSPSLSLTLALSFAPSLLLPLCCSLALSLSPSRSRLLPLSLSLSLSLPLAVPCCSCDAVCLGNVRSEIPDLEEVAVLQGVGVVVRLPMATGLGIALCVFFQDFQASDLHGARYRSLRDLWRERVRNARVCFCFFRPIFKTVFLYRATMRSFTFGTEAHNRRKAENTGHDCVSLSDCRSC